MVVWVVIDLFSMLTMFNVNDILYYTGILLGLLFFIPKRLLATIKLKKKIATSEDRAT